MNKFKIINIMQKSLIKQDNEKSWCLTVAHKHRNVSRSRNVSFIIKGDNGYLVTRTGAIYKNFMAALASLIHEFIYSLRLLIRSMTYDDSALYCDEIIEAALNGKEKNEKIN